MTVRTDMLGSTPEFNLVLGWLWVALGFGSGLLLGLFFHRENWLGGYGSFRRRLYRLGHISFFGLGVLNLAFYFTARELALAGPAVPVAGWAFAVGAVAMPLCCLVMAHVPRWRLLFAVPVLSLLLGGGLTVGLVASAASASAHAPSTIHHVQISP